ncbi:galactose-1-phosphate uridyl transferase [Tilletia horrida]|nr:galactose-1-phosphate uridyl transferase [Tilletia horrida]
MSGGAQQLPTFDETEHPHRRYNPLTQSWVLCSPHRTKRPWQGAQEALPPSDLPAHDPKCYLCPGNTRATGASNEKYASTFVFKNDYAALLPDETRPQGQQQQQQEAPPSFIKLQPARGSCYVLCFHPSHNLTLAQMGGTPELARANLLPIIQAWTRLYSAQIPEELTAGAEVDRLPLRYIQIFENKGQAMGCSNPHPHGQIWSLDYVPLEPLRTLRSLKEYALAAANHVRDADFGKPSLLLDYAAWELSQPPSSPFSDEVKSRIIHTNEHFLSVVPYWAVWPYEVLLLPRKRQIPSLVEMTPSEQDALAEMLGCVTKALDNIFKCSFPYSMGIHQRPVPLARTKDGNDLSVLKASSSSPPPSTSQSTEKELSPWLSADDEAVELGQYAQFHIHFYPPLLRSATVRKFLVGFEMLGEPQRDLTPEQAAARIRVAAEGPHYLETLSRDGT